MRRLLMSIVLLSVVAGGTLAVASTTPSQPAAPAFVAATPCNGNTCTLTVHIGGNQQGGVNSDDGMIICLHDGAPGCTANETKGNTPTLTANAGPGSVFSYWGGDCSGASDCKLTMDSNKDVTAVFSSGSSPQPSPS